MKLYRFDDEGVGAGILCKATHGTKNKYDSAVVSTSRPAA